MMIQNNVLCYLVWLVVYVENTEHMKYSNAVGSNLRRFYSNPIVVFNLVFKTSFQWENPKSFRWCSSAPDNIFFLLFSLLKYILIAN